MARRGKKHCVHGEWMTVSEAARRLGVRRGTLEKWRLYHRDAEGRLASLEDAWRAYRAYATGARKRYPGRRRAVHKYHGRSVTVREIAEEKGIRPNTIHAYMHRNRCTLQQAVDAIDRRRTERAVRKIVGIIMGANTEKGGKKHGKAQGTADVCGKDGGD